MFRPALAALALATSLSAQQGPELALVEKLYAKLAASFGAGVALGQGGECLILAHPGLAVSGDLLEDAHAVSSLADQIPLPARFYTPSGATYSDTYRTLLARAEVSSFQNMATRQEALKARRLTYDRKRPGQPTPEYRAYLKCRATYRSACDALEMARIEHQVTGKEVPPALERAVAKALAAWEEQGNRRLIEDAQRSLKTLYNENVAALFTDLRGELEGAQKTSGPAGPWLPVIATPPAEEWLSPAGWKPFTLTQEEKDLAPGMAGLPLEARPAKAADTHLPEGFLASGSLSLEAKRITLARPWLEEAIFSSHAWRLQRSSGFTLVSSGNPLDRDPGLMPFLVTGLLLSRKLVLKGQWSDSQVGNPKALGPFSLASPAGSVTKPLLPRITTRGGQLSLAVDGPQIIGFFCTPVPRSPSPDAKAFRTP